MLKEVNTIFGNNLVSDDAYIEERFEKVSELLPKAEKELINFLPRDIAYTLLKDRDAHGNV